MRRRLCAIFLILLGAPPQAMADAGPIPISLSNPVDQEVGQVFEVRISARLPAGPAQWPYTDPQGVQTMDTILSGLWAIHGLFDSSGVERVEGDEIVPSGNSFYIAKRFRCTQPGEARVGFTGNIFFRVPTPGGPTNERWREIPFTEPGRPFKCLAASTPAAIATPPGVVYGTCDPVTLRTDYGTFIGRIWREPDTDPLPLGRSTVVRTEVVNTSRDERFAAVPWSLSGDLWEHAGDGVAPRHADKGQHPFLYVGTPALPYRDSATFTCRKNDVAGLMHLMKIRWPDPHKPTGPMREATLTCYVPPFRCGGERAPAEKRERKPREKR